MLRKGLPTVLAVLSGLGVGIGVQQGQHPEYKHLHVEYWDGDASGSQVKRCGYHFVDARGALVKLGAWTAWHENGQKAVEGHFEAGGREGVWVLQDQGGRKLLEGTFKDNLPAGPFTAWHGNGRKRAEGQFNAGKRDGMYLEWHANGQKAGQANYRAGRLDGLKTTWHASGHKAEQASYKDGRLDGPKTVWHANGAVAAEASYVGGHLHGAWRSFYDSGQKAAEGLFKAGRPEGIQYGWHQNGLKAAEGAYNNGKRNGPWLSWHDNGAKELEYSCEFGIKRGVAYHWHANGSKAAELPGELPIHNPPKFWDETGRPLPLRDADHNYWNAIRAERRLKFMLEFEKLGNADVFMLWGDTQVDLDENLGAQSFGAFLDFLWARMALLYPTLQEDEWRILDGIKRQAEDPKKREANDGAEAAIPPFEAQSSIDVERSVQENADSLIRRAEVMAEQMLKEAKKETPEEAQRELDAAKRQAEERARQAIDDAAKPSMLEEGERVSFRAQIEPILKTYCVSCHGAGKKKGGLRLHEPDAIEQGGDNGAVLSKGKPADSPMYAFVALPLYDEKHMPPDGAKQPTAAEIALLSTWIKQGAMFDEPDVKAQTTDANKEQDLEAAKRQAEETAKKATEERQKKQL